jgi:hypothetical protein
MKIFLPSRPCATAFFCRAFVRGVLPAAAIGTALLAPDAGAQDSAKTHTLFMGADISVSLDTDLYPVRNVIGSSWVIDINGVEKVISARQSPPKLKITQDLKLTEVSATLAGFKREAAYSYGNDPSVRLTQGLSQTAAQNADAQAAVNQATAASMAAVSASEMGVNKASAANAGHAPADASQPVQSAITAASQNETAAQAGSGSNLSPGGTLVASEGRDAMDIEFEVSSARPLSGPYVVTMTRFHEANGDPRVVKSLVYAKAINPIDAHPTRVHFVEEGFPPNYQVVDFQLHLYNRGEEVATNVSPNRVELTRDEAFEYVIATYEGSHMHDTLSAAPAMGKMPADLPAQLAAGKYRDTFFVKVSKDGLADQPFSDAGCSRPIEDPYLVTVVKAIRFKPALDKGKPVEGTAPVNLAKLQV